ncbi:unnamed protein product [Symbiodinium sp. CCMP2592]|nr:unnamed protein product [Symbiodinium sp. CCMP2592]
MAALESGNKLSTLLPTFSSHWLPILEDISSSTAFCAKIAVMTKSMEANDEWHYVSMDATIKVCLKLLGQESYRASKARRDAAPFGDDTAWRRILTVRGRTGAVLLLQPLQNESSEQLVDVLKDNFTVDQLGRIVHVATDSPSEKLYTHLKVICPRLACLMLDPIHLAIVYEYGFWNKRSAGSKQLRRILTKCVNVDMELEDYEWNSYYDGTMSRPLNREEEKYRAMILNLSMPHRTANNVLDSLRTDLPFYSRLEFIKCIAALCQRYRTEVERKAAGPNKEIYKILWSSCAPDRLEWLMNNVRARQRIRRSYVKFLPRGTSSNEALHAELNSWSRSTNTMHRSTLALRLRFYHYIKMLQHHLSTVHPMTHTVSASMLLGRSLHESLWTPHDWATWCAEQQTDGFQSKASLPLTNARKHEAARVRQWVMKKPSASKRTSPMKKRHVTPLSVRRMHTLRSSGVKLH